MQKLLQASLDPIDKPDFQNPLLCSEYIQSIFSHMLLTESLNLPQVGYMKLQSDINERMRGILIDWLIEVHLKFKLLPETLYLTVNLIDRYLGLELITRDKLQLIGVTAMLIACKYEEIYPPELKDFVYITDNAYTKQQIMDMEYTMLKKLEFKVTAISSYRFLERINKLAVGDDNEFCLAQYLIELALVEYRMMKYKPSELAAGAVYLTHKITGRKEPWPIKVEHHTNIREKDARL